MNVGELAGRHGAGRAAGHLIHHVAPAGAAEDRVDGAAAPHS